MKITDTLDQLLRALLSASEDDARDASSTSGVVSSESAGPGTPIRGGVPAWRVTDDAKPDDGEGDARASAGAGPRFTTADAGASQTGEHALPDWVRRSQERAVAPAAPELVTLEAASMAADVEPRAVEEPSHVEVATFAVPEAVASLGTEFSAIPETGAVEAEPSGVEQPGPVGSELSAVAETAPVEAEPSSFAESGPVEPELSAVADTAPVETEPSAPVETGPVEVELSAVADTAPVETEPSALVETGPVEAEPSAGEWLGPLGTELSAVEEPSPVGTEALAVEEHGPTEIEPFAGDAYGAVEKEPVAAEETAPVEADLYAVEEPKLVDIEPSAEESIAVEHPAPTLEAFSTPIEIEPDVAVVDEERSPVEPADAIEATSASTELEPRPDDVLGAVEVEPIAPELDKLEQAGAVLSLTGVDLARLETAASLAESLNLGFHLGLAVERIATAAAQGSAGVPALREATWLIERYVALLERRPIGADIHVSAARLARTGDVIAGMKAIAAALDASSAESSLPAGEAPDDEMESRLDEVETQPASD